MIVVTSSPSFDVSAGQPYGIDGAALITVHEFRVRNRTPLSDCENCHLTFHEKPLMITVEGCVAHPSDAAFIPHG